MSNSIWMVYMDSGSTTYTRTTLLDCFSRIRSYCTTMCLESRLITNDPAELKLRNITFVTIQF